jgi:hypothetical protein
MTTNESASIPATAEPATLTLGAICGRLCFTISGAFLAEQLHVRPAATDKRAQLYTESQYQLICKQLLSHVGAMAELYAGGGGLTPNDQANRPLPATEAK